MVDTIRLLLFLDCNLDCPYCCNKQEQFNSQFQLKRFDEIDFSKYKNVCITGGEPFLKKDILYNTLAKIPVRKNIYLYTNGMMVTNKDIVKLYHQKNIKGINVGIHTDYQFNWINPLMDTLLPVRYTAELSLVPQLKKQYPDRFNRQNLKGWTLNDCNMSNEDWVLLRD